MALSRTSGEAICFLSAMLALSAGDAGAGAGAGAAVASGSSRAAIRQHVRGSMVACCPELELDCERAEPCPGPD